MSEKKRILWISSEPAPLAVRQAVGSKWELTPCRRDEPLESQLSGAALAVIYPNGQSNDPAALNKLLECLDHTSAVGLLLLPEEARAGWDAVAKRPGQFLTLPSSAAAKQISAKLVDAAALQPAIATLQTELSAARKAATNSAAFEMLDEEMRLAARLQRDFLPSRLPELGPVRFGVLFRPATWLSGDIYDIVRLDEKHLGFYIADAVGHGLPAALLTMFIKHALQTKRIIGNTYQIVPPEVSLGELNSDICQQNLSSCQFCTAIYCVMDVADLGLTYCRAGHPPALRVRGGNIESLDAPGPLLGVFPEEQFESRRIVLDRGDRVILYTDGAEEALRHSFKKDQEFPQLIEPLARLPREEFLMEMTAAIDRAQDTPATADDITVVVVDVEP